MSTTAQQPSAIPPFDRLHSALVRGESAATSLRSLSNGNVIEGTSVPKSEAQLAAALKEIFAIVAEAQAAGAKPNQSEIK